MRTPNLNISRGSPSINPTLHRGSIPTLRASSGADPRSPPRQRHAGDACGAAHRRRVDAAQCALLAEPLSGLQYAYRDSDGECFDQPVSRPMAAAANGGSGKEGQWRRARQRGADRASTCARSPTKSWPRSTARCPTRRPTNWRGVTASTRLQSQNFPLIGAHHRPVPHHRPPAGRDGAAANFAADGQRSFGAAEFPLCAAGSEGRR